MAENVFDLVDAFYTQDDDWNSVLPQSDVENFLRQKYWQGVEDDDLIDIWDNLTILCIYLGNTEKMLGDLSVDDYIAAVRWCCFNIADLCVTVEDIGGFLDTVAEFSEFLHKKGIVFNEKNATEAKEILLRDGEVQYIDAEGNWINGILARKYNSLVPPMLPANVFLNVGSTLDELFKGVKSFFSARCYKRDFDRASFLQGGILGGAVNEKPGTEEYKQYFWDYFLFDYHLMLSDKTPLAWYYQLMLEEDFDPKKKALRQILKELMQAKLVLFEVERRNSNGFYECRNLLSGEEYILSLPVEDDLDTEHFVFLGHIFYNNTMVMNFLQGMKMSAMTKKRFLDMLRRVKDWYAVRKGGKLAWEDFMQRNPMFTRHIALLYSTYVKMEIFDYDSSLIKVHYTAQPIGEDKVSILLKKLMEAYAFAAYDVFLVRTMWADYLAASGKNPNHVRVPEIWAAGVLMNFIQLNGVYSYTKQQIADMCYGIPVSTLTRTEGEVAKVLKIENHDPRYVNEEGLLLMLFL